MSDGIANIFYTRSCLKVPSPNDTRTQRLGRVFQPKEGFSVTVQEHLRQTNAFKLILLSRDRYASWRNATEC